MSKLIKTILGLAAVGTATAAGIAYYLKKNENEDDFLSEFEDEDYKAGETAEDREYVSLNQTPSAEEAEEAKEEDKEEDKEAEPAEEEKEEAAEPAEAEANEEPETEE